MAIISLQDFLDSPYKVDYVKSDWAQTEVEKILNEYGITAEIGNLLLGMESSEKAIILTFVSNEDLFIYTIALEDYYQYFKVIRNVGNINIRAYKNYNLQSNKVWYSDLFIGKEQLPVKTSLYVDDFIKTLIKS